jgi:hypothetical protein
MYFERIHLLSDLLVIPIRICLCPEPANERLCRELTNGYLCPELANVYRTGTILFGAD